MTPLEWGYEISEDTKREVTKQIIKKDDGQIIFEEDDIENEYNTNKKKRYSTKPLNLFKKCVK